MITGIMGHSKQYMESGFQCVSNNVCASNQELPHLNRLKI